MIVYANDDGSGPAASYCESRAVNLLLVSGSWRREVAGELFKHFLNYKDVWKEMFLILCYMDMWNCLDQGRKTGWLQSRKLKCPWIRLWCWSNQFGDTSCLWTSYCIRLITPYCLSHFQPGFSISCSYVPGNTHQSQNLKIPQKWSC